MATAKKPKVCLVLQGGGALGAYHIGAYQALEEAGYTPDWLAGISIGALNATILAGNPPEQRLAKLEAFWDAISRPGTDVHLPAEMEPNAATLFNTASATSALMFGQPNFFFPRPINPYFAFPGQAATSFYDTGPIFKTLQKLADFDLINSSKTRLTVGATRVTDGELVFFDSESDTMQPAHSVASGSLPPGFPATQVGEDFYWDGGVVSNTPLNGILDLAKDEELLIFMVDLWNARGEMPRTMNEVLWRQKEIQYASRTSHHIEQVVAKHNLKALVDDSGELIASEAVSDADRLKAGNKINIVHITYDAIAGHIPLSDTEFSRRSIRLRRECGYQDMQRALADSPWQQDNQVLPVRCHMLRSSDPVTKAITKAAAASKPAAKAPAKKAPVAKTATAQAANDEVKVEAVAEAVAKEEKAAVKAPATKAAVTKPAAKTAAKKTTARTPRKTTKAPAKSK
ncbi:patatin-like phospholipase family protein [Aliagarivorans marinus]|uniref:patatin-like phospholipase family protein n=1 Tax=Aliagarivorans marinus TaxID=561965 RepID=UPI00040A412A|nr:patatin-like phospholipase family protein [Aliagarivorans marinus]